MLVHGGRQTIDILVVVVVVVVVVFVFMTVVVDQKLVDDYVLFAPHEERVEVEVKQILLLAVGGGGIEEEKGE